MTYDTTNRKDIRRAEKDASRAAKDAAEAIVALCETTAGRRWVWDELASCHIFTTTFSPDPVTMAFNEGNRNRGLALLAQVMQFCPRQFMIMMEEANVRSHTADAERAGRKSDGRDADGAGGEYDPTDHDSPSDGQR